MYIQIKLLLKEQSDQGSGAVCSGSALFAILLFKYFKKQLHKKQTLGKKCKE